jgi:hypothetical protein
LVEGRREEMYNRRDARVQRSTLQISKAEKRKSGFQQHSKK